MAKKISAGLLMYRINNNCLEVFLAHPGGPYFTNKDDGFWGIPKGEVEPGEAYFQAALREFTEETGIIPHGKFLALDAVVLKSGKVVYAWAFEGTWDGSLPIASNLFEMEWPPHSGLRQQFPEIDRAAFFPAELAKRKANPAQIPFIERLAKYLQQQIPGIRQS